MKSFHSQDNDPALPSLAAYQDVLPNNYPSGAPLIYICPKSQQLTVFIENKSVFQCPVSTAKNGLGEMEGSNRTPRGLHRIHQVIGDGEPQGRIFSSRIPQPSCWHEGDPASGEDYILSRIIWLDGLEPGKNKGGSTDSKSRFIYIHGTNHEQDLGTPTSAGCIRLSNLTMILVADTWACKNGLCLIGE